MEPRNIWRTKRLIFRAVDEGDEAFLQTLNHYGSDGYQNASGALPVPQGKAGALQHRERLEKLMLGVIICIPAPTTGMEAKDNSAASSPIPIGSMGLTAAEPRYTCHRNTSMGINIVTPYQGQGYGTEAVLWGLEFAFKHANLHRVKIGALGWNEDALRLYQKLGFVVEGTDREAYWYDGGYQDCVWMGMLDREWAERYGGRVAGKDEVVAGAEK